MLGNKKLHTPPSLLSTPLIIEGNIKNTGEMHVDCIIEGTIQSTILIVGATGKIKGNVIADKLILKGRIEGQCHAKNIYLHEKSYIDGNIHYETIAIEKGALIKGKIIHDLKNDIQTKVNRTAVDKKIKQ